MDVRKKEIQKAIDEIEEVYPDDQLIVNYKDFLNVRESLQYFKFNPLVFKSFLELVYNKWDANERINRMSLLRVLRKYKIKCDKENKHIDRESRTLLFQIFKKIFEHPEFVSTIQIEEIRKTINSTLINEELCDQEIRWLCRNAHISRIILNRVLKYPIKSKIISDWVNDNYNKDNNRSRRAEMISWILDENPHFEIDHSTLIADLEYINLIDKRLIEEYDERKLIKGFDTNQVQNDDHVLQLGIDFERSESHQALKSEPELKLNNRFYKIPSIISNNYPVPIPDFERLKNEFQENIENIVKVTMLWAVAYSRLDNDVKKQLLLKYFSREVEWSFFKICKKLQFSDLLKWLLDQNITRFPNSE